MRVGHPTGLNELEARLQQIWNVMSQFSIISHRTFALEEVQQGVHPAFLRDECRGPRSETVKRVALLTTYALCGGRLMRPLAGEVIKEPWR
ncbi:hypothetical protein TNCV_3594011 [Trichonephila clavipes]|nr:hypothetical protein TNCV_3594011 [Trichonephila clavipes]